METKETTPQFSANGSLLYLFSVMARALSHQIRTPLSVISNDLFYFQSLLGEAECRRSVERCRQISSILSDLAAPFKGPFLLEKLDLTDLLKRSVSIDLTQEQKELLSALELRGDASKLEWVFKAISNLISGQSPAIVERAPIGRAESAADIVVELEVVEHVGSPKGVSKALRCEFGCPASIEKSGQKSAASVVTFASLSSYFNEYRKSDSLLSVVADVILQAHGCLLEVQHEPALKVVLLFPEAGSLVS